MTNPIWTSLAKQNSNPIPCVDECIIIKETQISAIDASRGYWFIKCEGADKYKTAFKSKHG